MWRVAVDAADETRQDAQLFTSIVANDFDWEAHYPQAALAYLRKHRGRREGGTFCNIGPQFQRDSVNVGRGFWVIAQNTEVMDRVAIDRVGIGLFLVVENSPTPERASSDYMSICQDIPSFGIHDKASGLAYPRQIPVERMGLRVANRHDAADDLFYCPFPDLGLAALCQGHGPDATLNNVHVAHVAAEARPLTVL